MGVSNSRPDPEEAERLKATFAANCAMAAESISAADVLVLVTGAGFSADSGLAVYGDVAKVRAYQERGLEYHDICQPHWLDEEPELFYGFWGQCFNDYRETRPHKGYHIVAKWRDDKNQSEVAAEMRRRVEAERKDSKFYQGDGSTVLELHAVDGLAGAFFCFTSNVDAHSFDVFRASEIRECHGNVEFWQCSKWHCGGSGRIWRAPLDHRFSVNTETMLAPGDAAPELPASLNGEKAAEKNRGEESSSAHVGHTFGVARSHPLKYMTGSDGDDWVCREEAKNYPICGECGANARPAILMFGDMDWKDNEAQARRWSSWKAALLSLCRERGLSNPLRVCIVEVGCGLNVRTCRFQSEDSLEQLQQSGGEVKLVRINPDFPLADDCKLSGDVISIMARGLETLEQIDQFIRQSEG